jgi:hypothetical protein
VTDQGSRVWRYGTAAQQARYTEPPPDVKHRALGLILPGLAILAAALAQLQMNAAGPQIRHRSCAGIAADSGFALATVAV